jgi:hypothetical protein
MVEAMPLRRALAAMIGLSVLTSGCSSSDTPPIGLDTSFSAQIASSWHTAGSPQRVQVGVIARDANGVRFLTQGTVAVSFAFLGADGGSAPVEGPSATAAYVPVPGTEGGGGEPVLSGTSRGVYEADDVVFDRPGVWRTNLRFPLDGVDRELDATFSVADRSPIPAPGDRAPRTRNLTIDSKGADPASIDSMAAGGGEIPDPDLHRWTIADAIDQGRPALVLFGTPAYCESRFCGPEVTELERLASEHPDRAVYVHIEIWKDYESQVVNEAAADWLLVRGPDGSVDLIEPYLFLIGADGRIVDRWGPLFDSAQVEAELEALPPMAS